MAPVLNDFRRQKSSQYRSLPSSLNLRPDTPGPMPIFMSRSTSRLNHSMSSSSSSSLTATDSPYLGAGRPLLLGDKYPLSPDPAEWGTPLSTDLKEADDAIHDPRYDWKYDAGDERCAVSCRGLVNLGALVFLCLGLVAFFFAYPLVSYFTRIRYSTQGGYNLGGINASGQVPAFPGNMGLIDLDTPKSEYTKPSWNGGPDMQLVFSDEFNVDGRTFYPGDDPYWEAVDLHYWQTNNLEWYSPAAVTTQAGALVITLSAKETHGLDYQGGLISSWNKFCFTGGYIEANVSLPGVNNIVGLWPAIWTLGNLGRVGYGASLDGLWPYTYDACDVGTLPNQTLNGLPAAALAGGDPTHDGALSYLDGQRLSRCTCPGEAHPGPQHSDGSFVGRAAPEIDVFEAQVTALGDAPLSGQVSQSAQWAPFDAGYVWQNTSANLVIADETVSALNPYVGGVEQQATSVITDTNQACYEYTGGCFAVYGFEYAPGFDDAYITWIANNEVAWTLNVAGMGADPLVEISARPVSQEPMYIIANLGMSYNFGDVDLAHILFPVHLRVDYVRVYQAVGQRNVGCDPAGFPTAAYIERYPEAYTNPNLTTWTGDYAQEQPKNKLVSQC